MGLWNGNKSRLVCVIYEDKIKILKMVMGTQDGLTEGETNFLVGLLVLGNATLTPMKGLFRR